MIVTVSITTVVWLAVTFLTHPGIQRHAGRLLPPHAPFRRRLASHRRGSLPTCARPPAASSNLLDWICGCVLIYGILFGTGKLLLEEFLSGSLLLAAGLIAGAVIYWDLSRRGWSTVVD